MLYHGGFTVEGFYDDNRELTEIYPRTLFDIPVAGNSRGIFRVPSVTKFVEKAESIALIRRYALGDVLMLIPVLRQMKSMYPEKRLYLVTTQPLAESKFVLKWLGSTARTIPHEVYFRKSFDLIILLDGILERDHNLEEYHRVPRVIIYQRFLELPEVEVGWTDEVPLVPRGKSCAVLCSSGAYAQKSLQNDAAEKLEKMLRKRGYSEVLHVGEQRKVMPEVLMESLERASVCVTMDSSVLWMSHFTRTPVVLISGPTDGSVRLAHHPLRPDGVAEVSLSKEIGCKPCFERFVRCAGNLDCLRPNSDRIVELVADAVGRVEWKIKGRS